MIDAPNTRTRNGKVKKYEAVKDRGITSVEDGEKGSWGMCHEVGDRHISSEDERHGSRKETKHDE
jgi:hypothetical protein